jgi:hypothetical protein
MQIDGVGSLLGLAVETLRNPKRCLRIILDIVITMPQVLQATVLVAALSTILSVVLLMVEPTEVQNAFSAVSANPLPLFIVQVATFLGTAGLVTYVGRLFQGHATFKEVLTALVWMQLVLFGISMVQLFLGLVAPFMAPVLFLASLMIMIHLTVNFIMELHGFKNVFAVITGIVGTFFALAFFFAIILTMLGLAPEAIQNV